MTVPVPPLPGELDGRFLPATLRGEKTSATLLARAAAAAAAVAVAAWAPGLAVSPASLRRSESLLQAPRESHRGPASVMADFDEIYEEEEDEERALEEQLLKHSPDPVVVRGSGHVTV